MSTRTILKIKKLSKFAVTPTRGSAGAAGYDLSAAKDAIVPARSKARVPTDLSIAVPHLCYGRIAPRSSLSWKHSIETGAGVVDEDYRGPVDVVLFNLSDVDYHIKAGDRIAQLILEKIEIADVEDVGDDELPETKRGEGGFGSTGVGAIIVKSDTPEVPADATVPVPAAAAAAESPKKRKLEQDADAQMTESPKKTKSA